MRTFECFVLIIITIIIVSNCQNVNRRDTEQIENDRLMVTNSDNIATTPHVDMAKGPEKTKDSKLVFVVIGIVLLGVFLSVIIGILIYRRRRTFMYGKKVSWVNKQLSNECEAKFKYDSYNQLLQVTNLISKQESAAEMYLIENIGSNKEDQLREANDETREIKTCNDPTVACLKRTQIHLKLPCKNKRVPLNINALNDYYMNFLYIGQINVVVWIENGLPENCHMPIRQLHMPETYGAYSVRNVAILSWLNLFKTYELEFIRSYRFIEGQARRLIVLQVQSWPCNTGDPIEPEKLIQVIENVSVYQKSQHKTTSTSNNILLQCKTGTEQSATFAALFIGEQMWLNDFEINVVGIMRYIRSCRHGAFTKSVSPGFQTQIVFSALTFLTKDKPSRGAINDVEGKSTKRNLPIQKSLLKQKVPPDSRSTTSSKSAKIV